MALPRFAKLSAERRHRLISSAAFELAEKGYQGAGLLAIAEKSGVGKSSFYYYFADKADLCATVLDEAWRQFALDGRVPLANLTAENFWSSVEHGALENVERCRREPWLLAAAKVLNKLSNHATGEPVLDEYRARRYAWETAFIRRGQELGTVRTDVPAELLVTISFNARLASNLWLLEHVESMTPEVTDTLAAHVFEIYRAILSPPGPWATTPVQEPATGERRA